jgi:hypothetical protein
MPWYLHLYQALWLAALVLVYIKLGGFVALGFLYVLATAALLFA